MNDIDIVEICEDAINKIITKYESEPISDAIFSLMELEIAKEITSSDQWPYDIDYDINVFFVDDEIYTEVKILNTDPSKPTPNKVLTLTNKKEDVSAYDYAMEIVKH